MSTIAASDFRAIDVNTPALSIIHDSIINAGDTMVEISLLSLLFGECVGISLSAPISHKVIGILTVLSFTSMYFLA